MQTDAEIRVFPQGRVQIAQEHRYLDYFTLVDKWTITPAPNGRPLTGRNVERAIIIQIADRRAADGDIDDTERPSTNAPRPTTLR